MAIHKHRPKDHIGENDTKLNDIFQGMKRLLKESQKILTHSTLRLHPKTVKIFAAILVEFAEDLHCDIGIWKSYE